MEWGIFANQVYLYGMGNMFEVTLTTNRWYHCSQVTGTTAPLHRERVHIRLQGFNYCLNYVPGKKEGSENNEADYHSQHPEPLTMQKSQTCKSQAEFELRETVEEFEKDVMDIVKSSLPEAVNWQELLEETHSDTELSDLKEAIARGYLTTKEKRTLGPQFDAILTELAVAGELVV